MSNYPDNEAPTRAYFDGLAAEERRAQEIAEDYEAGSYARRIASVLEEVRALAREAQINGDIDVPPQAGIDRASRKAAEIEYAAVCARQLLEELLTPDACKRVAAYQEVFPNG